MQTGHQCPARTWYATAHQMCPSAQRHFTCWSVLERLSERHSPPIRQAVSCKPRTVIAIVPAHDGHHVPARMLYGTASHSCPSLHLHRCFDLAPRYCSDKHAPPRELASFCNSARACTGGNLPAHLGHHCPCWMSLGWASHSWPLAHFHFSFVLLLMYSEDKHSPPLPCARSLIASIVFAFWRPCFLLPQIKHQWPALTFSGIAAHSCPSAHRQRNFVFELMYAPDKHKPPRSTATCLRKVSQSSGLLRVVAIDNLKSVIRQKAYASMGVITHSPTRLPGWRGSWGAASLCERRR